MSPKCLIRAALLCFSLLAAAAGAQTSQPPPQQAAPDSGPVRNVVLVHGAFLDGSSWNGVIDRLQKKGYHVSAVQIPLTSLADDAAATRRVLARQNGPTILVGHSWGGTVITEVGADAPNVVGLVYVAAIPPDVGETTADQLKHGPESPANAGIQRDGNDFLWFNPAAWHNDLAADVPQELTRVLAAGQQPIAAKALSEPVTRAAWESKPSWYVVTTRDRAVPPETQEWVAQRIGATVVRLPSSHLAPVSHPSEVAAVIEQAAREESKQ